MMLKNIFYHRVNGWFIFCILIFTAVSGFPAYGQNTKNTKTILFFGDSITAGLGVGESAAYPALIQEKIDSLKWPYRVVNAGVSGETSSDGLNRIGWVLQRPVDIFVLELGGNDGLRGINLNVTYTNLQGIIDSVRQRYSRAAIVIEGMKVPPNLGIDYTTKFAGIFPELARKNHVLLIPFVLEPVAGNPLLNQGDGIHPTREGHKLVADYVWKYLKPLLYKMRNDIPVKVHSSNKR